MKIKIIIFTLVIGLIFLDCNKEENDLANEKSELILPMFSCKNTDGSSIYFVFDTGGQTSILDSTFYYRNINSPKAIDTIKAGRPDRNEILLYPVFKPPKYFSQFISNRVNYFPLVDFRSILPVIDVMVGGDFLNNKSLRINATDGILELFENKKTSKLQFNDSSKILLHNNLPYLYATLYIREDVSFEGMFLIDTGSNSDIVLWPHVIEKYGIDTISTKKYYSESKNSHFMGNDRGHLLKADSMQICNTSFDNFDIYYSLNSDLNAIQNENYVGLIGFGILQNFDFLIDYKRKYIYFSEVVTEDSICVQSAGIRPGEETDEGLVIQGMIYDSPADSADIRIGDILLEADGLEANRQNYLTLIKKLKTPGTVTLKLKRKDSVFIKKVPVKKLL